MLLNTSESLMHLFCNEKRLRRKSYLEFTGSAMWKYGNYGSKYEKACQLKEKGKNIVILKEKDVKFFYNKQK